MSTKFTRSPSGSYELVDSHSLNLMQAMGGIQQRIVVWLISRLKQDGFDDLTASQLQFLGALDCGPNHAAQIAREMGITRQAVYKTIRELEKAGWLETHADKDRANQRVIHFTLEGERMMALARRYFADLDSQLSDEFTDEELTTIIRFMTFSPSSN